MSLLKNSNSLGSALYTDLFNIDRFFEQPSLRNHWLAGRVPAANISETDKEFVIELAVPGIERNNIRIDLESKVLTVSAEQETKEEKTEHKGRYTRREYSYDSFSRSFELPDTVEADHITATHDNGVLQLHLPKRSDNAVGAKRRQIEIA